jgi:hypothetical protein
MRGGPQRRRADPSPADNGWANVMEVGLCAAAMLGILAWYLMSRL